jgi:hypothetical protein
VFLFSGAVAAVAGGLFAALQSYIMPDAFTLDLSILFFIAILIGGRGSILGPLLGTIILTALPEFAAPLVAWSTFLYAVLLLVIVLAVPGGIAEMLDYKNRRPLEQHREIRPRPELLPQVMGERAQAGLLTLKDLSLSFGGVRAIDGVDFEIKTGEARLIGPNGSGDHDERDFWILRAAGGCDWTARPCGRVLRIRAGLHVPAPSRPTADRRHFRPRKRDRRRRKAGSFVESLLALSRHRRDEAHLREAATAALAVVAWSSLLRAVGPLAAQRAAFRGDSARADAAPVAVARRARSGAVRR